MKTYTVSSSSFVGKSLVKKEEYLLETFKRSNQDTCLTHKPAIYEGTWVQSGDLLTDCASSVGGELSLGQNLLIAYMPWEGYNFEDAILVSERLVIDDLYTSIHIERYELEIQKTKLGIDEITRNIPDVPEEDLASLDSFGIIKLGSWVEEGNILVGKITPINKKKISPYQKLLYTILEKQVRPIKDSSLRAPKGIKAKVIDIKYFLKSSNNLSKVVNNKLYKKNKSVPKEVYPKSLLNTKSKLNTFILKEVKQKTNNHINLYSKKLKQNSNLLPFTKSKKYFTPKPLKFDNVKAKEQQPKRKGQRYAESQTTKGKGQLKAKGKDFLSKINFSFSKIKKNSFNIRFTYVRYLWLKSKKKYKTSLFKVNSINSLLNCVVNANSNPGISLFSSFSNNYSFGTFGSFVENKKGQRLFPLFESFKAFKQSPNKGYNILKKKEFIINNIEKIHIYLAEKRKIQVGDKMAGRHGNKGIVSQILPIQDMPYLPDGTPIDMVLNPLGVPSRMNVGQIYECLLGLAGKFLGENYKVYSFDEIYGPEASRAFVFNKLYEARSKTGFKWLFDPNTPGKIRLFDGRNGQCFDQKVTVGQAYMLRLVHMVDDKIHCLTPDHEVLTNEGWVPITEVHLHHQVATLNKTGELEYQNPTDIFHYLDYKGALYHVKNKNVDLVVTLNHRMYVRKDRINSVSFKDYSLIQARYLIGQHCQYLNNAIWIKDDHQFMLPSVISNPVFIPKIKVDMNAWLLFFGLWISKGWAVNDNISSKLNQISVDLNPIFENSETSNNYSIDSDGYSSESDDYSTDSGGYSADSDILLADLYKILSDFDHVSAYSGDVSTEPNRNSAELLDVSKKIDPILVVPFDDDTYTTYNFSKSALNNYSYAANQKKSILSKAVYQVQLCQHKERLSAILSNAVSKLGYNSRVIHNKLTIHNKQLWSYLKPLSVGYPHRSLPSWVWQLSQKQAQLLLLSMCLGCVTWRNKSFSYYTSSDKLADDVMRLALHAGWSANKYIQNPKVTVTGNIINDCLLTVNYDLWRISIIKGKNNPAINYSNYKTKKLEKVRNNVLLPLSPPPLPPFPPCPPFPSGRAGREGTEGKGGKGKKPKVLSSKSQWEEIFPYEGSVHCLSVPNEVFYVRRNGIPVWTGNSRSTGPYSLVTQQPLRGRSKQGGQRLGEMEVWALEGYGAAFTLLEMLTIKSDDMTGRMTLWSNLILNKDISIGTPESFKVLVCELQALCLDIGLFRNINVELNTKNSNLREITNLMNLP